MPGVPSSRGCNACREQKKRCDQSMPLCSRCTRLGIPCIGSGERRYKFMPAGPDRNTSQPTTSSAAQAESSSPAGSSMPRAPSNQATLDASHFVSALQVTDVCFDLRIYGPFFTDLPRRLGRNRALDASVRALTTSFPSVRTHRCTPDMYKAYGEALGCLRASLDDPATAGSVETLCAVYLVMICQGWIGRGSDFYPSHGEAIAHMLNTAAAAQNWRGEFEAEVTNTLLFIVLLESFGNHKINLDPRLWATSEGPAPIARPSRQLASQAANIECLQIPALAAMASFTRDVQGNLPAIHSTYETLRSDLAKAKAILSAVSALEPTLEARRIHARRQTAYGTLLLLALMANWALSMYGVGDARGLELEKITMIDEVVELAQQASRYRPLAASAMSGFVMAAKAMTDDEVRLERLEELLVLYRADFPVSN